MELLNVIVAGIAGFAFGAVWYIALGSRWMAVSGVPVDPSGRPANGMKPMIVGLVAMIVVAGVMRHILAGAGIADWSAGLVAGAGLGAFVVVPYLAMNYAFSARPVGLTVIDGGNAIGSAAVIGLVLALF